jgi:hypothetical protein
LTECAKEAKEMVPQRLRGLFGERNGVSVDALRGDEHKRTFLEVDGE